MRWRPIKTLPDDIDPCVRVVLWNSCDGPHFLDDINANGCYRPVYVWRESGMFVAWAIMDRPSDRFFPAIAS